MAIRIIKEGKKKIAVYKETCTLCTCEFEYNFEDTTSSYVDGSNLVFVIKCPNCNKDIQTFRTNPIRYDVIE